VNDTDEQVLVKAQRRLKELRRQEGIKPLPPVAADAPNFNRALAQAAGPKVAGARRCGLCGDEVAHPGICAACGAKLAESARGEQAKAAIEQEIPKRFAWASWDAPELARRVAGGERMVVAARRALASAAPVVVLLGAGRAGKSSLAAAWLRGVISEGRLGARWVPSRDLATEEAPEGRGLPLQRAIAATRLVLDDLGAELDGAPRESGLLAQRAVPAAKVITERHDRDRPMVITTSIGAELPVGDTGALRRAMADYYGDNIAGRIYEHAAVVRVEAPRARQAAEVEAARAGAAAIRSRS
jgi:hypothetical protein